MRLALNWHSWMAFSFSGLCFLVPGCSNLSSSGAPSQSVSAPQSATPSQSGPTSDAGLVAKYDQLASEILDTRKKEVEVVRTLLNNTFRDAEAALGRAREALKTPNSTAAGPAVENLAILVSYIATEGDASVARVRKRLIEGGHHFNPLGPAGAGPEGAHHGAPGAPAHNAPQGQAGHHAPGQEKPAEGGTAQAPPAGHAGGTAPAGQAAPGAAAPAGGHAAGEKPAPGHAAGEKTAPGHHAAGEKPAGGAGHAEGGQPHHAGPEAHHKSEAGHHQGNVPLIGYDPGYVVVSRAAKKNLLDASRSLGRLAAAPTADALDAEWKKVAATCAYIGLGSQ